MDNDQKSFEFSGVGATSTIASFCVGGNTTVAPTERTLGETATIGIGELVSRYKLGRRLGRGGFGEVWEAYDSQRQRSVAIKAPRTDRPVTRAQAQMMLREGEKARRLRGAQAAVVEVLDVIEQPVGEGDAAVCFLVMELMKESLRTKIDDGRLPDTRGAVRWVISLAATLDVLHRQGIVHRDIKPDNILFNEQDEPHLSDFGLAATLEELIQESRGRTGTVQFMAPEQAQGQRADRAADIYSLGVVLYQLLALPVVGRADLALPYLESSQQAYLAALCDQTAHRRRLPSETPAALAAIVEDKCLQDDPANRYRTARALQRDLASWLWRPWRRAMLAASGAAIAGAAAWPMLTAVDQDPPGSNSSQPAQLQDVNLLRSEPRKIVWRDYPDEDFPNLPRPHHILPDLRQQRLEISAVAWCALSLGESDLQDRLHLTARMKVETWGATGQIGLFWGLKKYRDGKLRMECLQITHDGRLRLWAYELKGPTATANFRGQLPLSPPVAVAVPDDGRFEIELVLKPPAGDAGEPSRLQPSIRINEQPAPHLPLDKPLHTDGRVGLVGRDLEVVIDDFWLLHQAR